MEESRCDCVLSVRGATTCQKCIIARTARALSPFKTLADVKAINAANGYNFFSKEIMRFWKSRMESSLIKGRYFVTSEEGVAIGRAGRVYSLRYAKNNGSVRTVVSHCSTKQEAKDAISKDMEGQA